MSPFEFSFTLFGLVLGLAMAELLGGLARVLRARSPAKDLSASIRIGWFTPALALVVALDLIASWNLAWRTLSNVPVNTITLTIGFFETGMYFLAATLVWPDAPGDWPDVDRWFARHKAQVGGAITAANLGFSAIYAWLEPGHYASPLKAIGQVLYVLAAASLIFTRRPWQSAVALGVLLAVLARTVLDPLM
jgi:hypothetical protein